MCYIRLFNCLCSVQINGV